MIVMSLDDRSARINHGSSVPVSVQVAADLEADIEAGNSRLTLACQARLNCLSNTASPEARCVERLSSYATAARLSLFTAGERSSPQRRSP